MMSIVLVGIGTGNPDHLTLEGRRALREARTILLPRKAGKMDLVELREAILDTVGSTARRVTFAYPERDPDLPYADRVEAWHDEIARRWSTALRGVEGPVALLVWGDPALYDSTLRIARRLTPTPRIRVVPGISAIQALTAAHGMPWSDVNGTVAVTTGRRLRTEGLPDADAVFVMLDGECSFRLLDPERRIWWGAFLGLPHQILASGQIGAVGNRIVAARSAARDRHGWIMDTYLIRPKNFAPTQDGDHARVTV